MYKAKYFQFFNFHLFQPEFYEKSHTKAEYYERGPSICRHNAVFGVMAWKLFYSLSFFMNNYHHYWFESVFIHLYNELIFQLNFYLNKIQNRHTQQNSLFQFDHLTFYKLNKYKTDLKHLMFFLPIFLTFWILCKDIVLYYKIL